MLPYAPSVEFHCKFVDRVLLRLAFFFGHGEKVLFGFILGLVVAYLI